MRAFAHTKARVLLAFVVALAGIGLASLNASAATVAINLCAVTGTATPTGSVTVPIWGFADGGPGSSPVCTPGTGTLPGPRLVVNEGDVVTVNVTNALPAGHPLTFEIPGITFDPGPVAAASGATVTRTFTASAPGTYLYSSGGDAGRQQALGMAGALLVRSGTAG